MVLESLISPMNAERHPKEMMIFGMIYSFIAAILAYWVFNQYASIVLVFLTTMAASPLIYKIIRYEEKKDTENYSEKNLLKEHNKALSAFMWLFLGVTIMLSIMYVVLPAEKASTLFEAQIDTITQINGKVIEETSKTGVTEGVEVGRLSSSQIFSNIFLNNIRVLIFCILFSFLYGIGALFILMWNASVIAVALGGFIKEQIYMRLTEFGSLSFIHYFNSVSLGILRYSIHGVPEILAYIIAGLAGGIISVAIIRYDFTTKNFEKIIFDTSNLLIISLGVLFVAALLEVYVTPIFF